MTAGRPGGRTAGLAALLILAVGPSARPAASQQVAPNRALAYLFPTDVEDARAIWVNPAGLAVKREASIYAEVAVGDPGAKGRLRQINAGFNSGGFAFAYQRDILDNGARGSTYRIGIGGGTPTGDLAAGIDVARYEGGGTHATGWEFGIRYVALPGLATGLVATNVGQPIVRGLVQKLTFVPGLTWHPGPVPALGFSTDARITPDSVASYAFGLSWQTGGASRWPLALIARLDTDRGLRRGAFAFGFSIGGQDRGGLVATTPGDVSSIDEASLYGVSRREPSPSRP